jgi:predicted small secreted protein
MKYFTIILVALSLGACSTVAGVGKDIQDAAEYTKEKVGSKL